MTQRGTEHRIRLLDRYLAALPAERQHVRLALTDLEALLGPATGGARSLPSWPAHGAAQDVRWHRGVDAHDDRTARAITVSRHPRQEA